MPRPFDPDDLAEQAHPNRLQSAAARLAPHDVVFWLETAARAEEALVGTRRPMPDLLLDINAPDVLFAPRLLHELARLRLLARGVFADAKMQQQARADLGRIADAIALREPRRMGRPPVPPFEETARDTVRASARALAGIIKHAADGRLPGSTADLDIPDSQLSEDFPNLAKSWLKVLPTIRMSPRFPAHLTTAIRACRATSSLPAPRLTVHVSRRWHELSLSGEPITETTLRAPFDGRLPWDAARAKANRKSRLLSAKVGKA